MCPENDRSVIIHFDFGEEGLAFNTYIYMDGFLLIHPNYIHLFKNLFIDIVQIIIVKICKTSILSCLFKMQKVQPNLNKKTL